MKIIWPTITCDLIKYVQNKIKTKTNNQYLIKARPIRNGKGYI